METSAYGSELVAVRIVVQMIIEYRYKLRLLGVPIIRMSVLYGDNITNTSIPGSIIKKKHHACAYHFIIELWATGIVNLIYKQSKQNQINKGVTTIFTLQYYKNTHLQQRLGFTEYNQVEHWDQDDKLQRRPDWNWF